MYSHSDFSPVTSLTISDHRGSQLKRIFRLIANPQSTRKRLKRGGAIAFTVLLALFSFVPIVIHHAVASSVIDQVVSNRNEEGRIATGDVKTKAKKGNQPPKKKIGSVFGTAVFESDLNSNVSANDNLLKLFIQPLTRAYLKKHPEIDPTEKLNKMIENKGKRAAALIFVRRHRLHKHLFERHGGRVVLSAFGPIAIDAQARWLADLEKSGEFELTFPPLRAALEELKTIDPKQLLATPQQAETVFDEKMVDKFTRNLLK